MDIYWSHFFKSYHRSWLVICEVFSLKEVLGSLFTGILISYDLQAQEPSFAWKLCFFPIKVDLFNFKLLNQAKNIPLVQPSYSIKIKIKLKWKLKSIKGFRNPALPENSVFPTKVDLLNFKPKICKLRTFPWFLNQNLRKICQGLWSDKQTSKQINRDYNLIYIDIDFRI